MGYMHIDNLYKDPFILQFKEVYALEKIHGTSAHIKWKNEQLTFFAGGSKHETFMSLFTPMILDEKLRELSLDPITIYGEAYGGKLQGMSKTYGTDLRFIVFDVMVGDIFVNVPNAKDIADKLGLEFVAYDIIPTDIPLLDILKSAPSVQSVRLGLGDHPREGIVLRPLEECYRNNDGRVIAKHKNDDFSEVKIPRLVDQDKLKKIANAERVAFDWVTSTRLDHVLDKLGVSLDITQTGNVIKAMAADILREGDREIEPTPEVVKVMNAAIAKLYKQKLQGILYQ